MTRRNVVFFVFFIFIFNFSFSQIIKEEENTNVLFIGNSLTYYNDMPQILQELLNNSNEKVSVYQSTFPGIPLHFHLNNYVEIRDDGAAIGRELREGEISKTDSILRSREWDIVVLQGSMIPNKEINEKLLSPFISQIKSILNNNKSKIYLFENWIFEKEYPKQNCIPRNAVFDSSETGEICSKKIESKSDEINYIENSFLELANETNTHIAKIGLYYYNFEEYNSSIELLEDDLVHPSKYGAFLNACIFYKIITNKNPKSIRDSDILDPEKESIIINFISKQDL